ncbi:hypothetical protein UFOVP257_5 [uncultured Caudovirales phage]|uniref:Uncharacterized protein n=1 Tax=uncultured Caudovirales phage TaxID=2100421 RepID=A0A6J5LI85_9CAUD|nr:hypothetical protein UFOVP257_5 [uncultured Caudovirales phage]
MSVQNTALTTSAQSVYTSTGNTVVSTMHIPNYTGTPITCNVWVVANGGSPTFTNIIYGNVTITAYNTLVVDREKFILGNGDALYANVSVNSSASATITYTGI